MKIVYCVGSLRNKGGMEKVLANKTSYFVNNNNYEITIITQDQNRYPLCYKFDKKINFHDVKISELNKRTIRGFTFLKNIYTLRKVYQSIFDEVKPDIIINCERGYLDFVIPFVSKPIPKIREFHFSKEAVSVHASLMKSKEAKKHLFMYFFIFKMFNKYDYLALLTKRDQLNGKYKTKTVVIPNMMSTELPREIAKLETTNVISVGSMHDNRKGFDTQIKLWVEISKKHPKWILNIFGSGKEMDSLKKLVNRLELNKNVILHGNSNTMEKHYLNSSIFLFTSKAEGLPMVLIEAQSYGIPCVSFDCPTGPSDIITDSINGYVVNQNDIISLEEKLIELIENKELRKKMGKKAREKSEQYTPENISKLWVNLFNKITNVN